MEKNILSLSFCASDVIETSNIQQPQQQQQMDEHDFSLF